MVSGTTLFWRLAVLVLALLPVVLADDNLFAGCYSALPSGSDPPATGGATRPNSDACMAYCGTVPKTHSYYNATGGQCFCSNGTPWQQNLVAGNAYACGSNYDNRNVKTTYMALQPQCYATQPGGITTQNTNTFTGLNGCLNSCKMGLRATFWANRAANNYFCSCVYPSSYGAGADCGPTTYFGYYHTPAAAASGLTRRKQREAALAEKRAAERHHCPRGWTACLVDARDQDTFECIDTKSELESCGGCLMGQYQYLNATVGENCAAMRGTRLGSTTCIDGGCVAYSCKTGYKLVNGRCR